MSLSIDRDKFQAADKPTLYKQIRLDIERRILTGEWPPGHRIPFEHQLMTRYGCSRMTVSKALSELAQTDLIERRRFVLLSLTVVRFVVPGEPRAGRQAIVGLPPPG